jgi:uncharacterized protein (DUF433 family)
MSNEEIASLLELDSNAIEEIASWYEAISPEDIYNAIRKDSAEVKLTDDQTV